MRSVVRDDLLRSSRLPAVWIPVGDSNKATS